MDKKIIYEKYLQFFEDKSYLSMGLIGFDTLNELEHYYLLEGIYPAILKTSKIMDYIMVICLIIIV
jgi:hypothetical protein